MNRSLVICVSLPVALLAFGRVGLSRSDRPNADRLPAACDMGQRAVEHVQGRKSIAALTAELGHETFRTRETATRDLIALGKTNIATRNLVRSAMNHCKRRKDPEVSERARRILSAIFPPRKPPKGVDAVTRPS